MQAIEKRVKEILISAEVVFETSNPQGTAEILRGCLKGGIPAHGPVW